MQKLFTEAEIDFPVKRFLGKNIPQNISWRTSDSSHISETVSTEILHHLHSSPKGTAL